MRSIASDPELARLADRVLHHAQAFGRILPEIRFFILERLEFASLLEKKVYPSSPINIWEGKEMVRRKHRIQSGQESALYYEVVQGGNPSYAYLNSSNNAVTQASVMAHVVGHCEFSELNVLKDSNPDRTEYVMYLSRAVDRARVQMGARDYLAYWNACESASALIAPNSQHNLERSIETDAAIPQEARPPEPGTPKERPAFQPVFETLTSLLKAPQPTTAFEHELREKRRGETLSRKGYILKAPCQDILAFLRHYAPASKAERAILDYKYVTEAPGDFVQRTQIMNEGWAMYWEKKLMLELFKEKAVAGIIDYSRVFSAVCQPRPYFQRNPYHLGYNLWKHIEKLYKEGKVSLSYQEETDLDTKERWDEDSGGDPLEAMRHLVRTVTDYEFLRRFLTTELIHEFHLNRIDRDTARQLGIQDADTVEADERWCWLDPEPIKDQMLASYSHFFRPRIYVIDNDFQDGGLLLFHRDDGHALRKDWIEPTLRNLNVIWKGPVAILSKGELFATRGSEYQTAEADAITFEQVCDRISSGEKPFRPN